MVQATSGVFSEIGSGMNDDFVSIPFVARIQPCSPGDFLHVIKNFLSPFVVLEDFGLAFLIHKKRDVTYARDFLVRYAKFGDDALPRPDREGIIRIREVHPSSGITAAVS